MVFVIILGIASYICTDNTLSRTEQTVGDISLSFENGDTQLAKNLSARLSEEWKKDCSRYMLIIDKDYMIEITLAVTRIGALTEDEDPEVLAECRTLLGLMKLCRMKENFELRNIF